MQGHNYVVLNLVLLNFDFLTKMLHYPLKKRKITSKFTRVLWISSMIWYFWSSVSCWFWVLGRLEFLCVWTRERMCGAGVNECECVGIGVFEVPLHIFVGAICPGLLTFLSQISWLINFSQVSPSHCILFRYDMTF